MKTKTQEIIIVDTSGLISLLVDTDSNHSKALQLSEQYDFQIAKVVIPNDVFTECINVLGKKFSHEKAVEVAQYILDSPIFSIIDTDDDLRTRALSKFKEQHEAVSYTDCIVMALADGWETTHIFGFDKVFQKNGYTLPMSPKKIL